MEESTLRWPTDKERGDGDIITCSLLKTGVHCLNKSVSISVKLVLYKCHFVMSILTSKKYLVFARFSF